MIHLKPLLGVLQDKFWLNRNFYVFFRICFPFNLIENSREKKSFPFFSLIRFCFFQGMPSDLSPGSSLHLLQQATSMAAFNALHDKFDTYSNSSSEGGRGSPPSKYLSEPPTPSGYGTPGFHFKLSPGASLPQTPTPSGYFTDHSSSAADIDDFIEIWPKFMNHYSQHKHCVFSVKCPLHETDHFHCKDAHCEMPFKWVEHEK